MNIFLNLFYIYIYVLYLYIFFIFIYIFYISRKLKHNFGQVDQDEPPVRREPILLPRKQPSPPPTDVPRREPSPPRREPSPPRREPSPPPRQPSPPRRQPSPPRREPSPPPREPSPPPRQPSPPPREPSPEPIQPQQPAVRNMLSDNLPKRQVDSDEEENDEDDWGENGKLCFIVGCFGNGFATLLL